MSYIIYRVLCDPVQRYTPSTVERICQKCIHIRFPSSQCQTAQPHRIGHVTDMFDTLFDSTRVRPQHGRPSNKYRLKYTSRVTADLYYTRHLKNEFLFGFRVVRIHLRLDSRDALQEGRRQCFETGWDLFFMLPLSLCNVLLSRGMDPR